MRKWILVVVAGFVLACVALVLIDQDVSRRTNGGAAGARPDAARAPSGEPPRLPAPGRWHPGLDRTCKLAFDTTIAGEQPIVLRVGGDWQTTVVDGEAGRPIVRVQLAGAVVALGGDAPPPALIDQVERPWFLELDPAGRIEAAWFDPGVEREARDLLKTVAAYLQECPAGGGRCERTEQDATGTYQARYEYPGPGQVTRVKQRYLSIVTQRGEVEPGAVGGPEVGASRARFELDPSGWPTHVAVAEEMSVALPSSGQALAATVALEADCQAGAPRPDLVGAFTGVRHGLRRIAPLAEPRDERSAAAEHDRQELGGATYPELVAALGGAADEHAEAAAQRRLRALFSLEPSEARRAAELLAGDELPVSGKKTLIAALTASGTADAQDVVVDYLAGATATEMRQQALASLGMTPTPTGDTLAALSRIADAPADPADRNTALLALGNAARRAGDPDAIAGLLARLERAATPDETVICLRALGNTADPRALPALQQALRSGLPEVRAAAVSALRLVADESVDALVGEVLLADGDERVRAEAVFAATFRPLGGVLPALERAMRDDDASRVRLAVVELLGNRRAESALCEDLLAWAAENDEDAGVREAASRARGS